MPFQPVYQTVQVVFNYEWNTVPCANVVHFTKNSGEPDADDVADAAITAAFEWNAGMRLITSNTVTLLNVTATAIGVPMGPQYVFAAGYVGANLNPSEARNVSFCVSFTSSLAGRSGRGRFYFVGITENVVANSELTVAQADGTVDEVIDLVDGVEVATGMSHTIASRRTGGAPRPLGLPVLVTGYGYSDLVVDTQRRRLH